MAKEEEAREDGVGVVLRGGEDKGGGCGRRGGRRG